MLRNLDNEVRQGAVHQGVDYSWRFEVSTFGRTRNVITGKIYSCGYGAGGYQQVCIPVSGRRLNVRIHRCVAEIFIPNPVGYEIVSHTDGCKQYNWVDNLEWRTRQRNYFYAVDSELIDYDVPAQLGYLSHLGAYTGSCNGMSKLTEDDVWEIRTSHIPRGSDARCNKRELANQYGVSANLISKIASGQIWTHV